MSLPLISVILPIYNIENYLPKCMESLFAQTYRNLEFIMVDDGSSSKCAKLVDDYLKIDDRVVVYHKENGGLSDARNYGIAHAKGEFMTCVVVFITVKRLAFITHSGSHLLFLLYFSLSYPRHVQAVIFTQSVLTWTRQSFLV